MRIGPLGIWELLIILVVVLLIFGPRRLPEMAKGLGQSVREFRKGIRDIRNDFEEGEKDDSAPPAASNAPAQSSTPPQPASTAASAAAPASAADAADASGETDTPSNDDAAAPADAPAEEDEPRTKAASDA